MAFVARSPFPSVLRLSRAAIGMLAALALAAGLAACSSSATSGSSFTTGTDASCSGVSGPNHVRLVVETSAGHVQSRCVGFSGATIKATALLTDSKLELGTQQYSFGEAICQAEDVPAHYSQCLPSGKPYWALFVSRAGAAWTNPPVGVSDITLSPGDSLGLRYDSPQGTPAPPPRTPKA